MKTLAWFTVGTGVGAPINTTLFGREIALSSFFMTMTIGVIWAFAEELYNRRK